MIEGIILGIFI